MSISAMLAFDYLFHLYRNLFLNSCYFHPESIFQEVPSGFVAVRYRFVAAQFQFAAVRDNGKVESLIKTWYAVGCLRLYVC